MTILHPRADNNWLFYRHRWNDLGSVDRAGAGGSGIRRPRPARPLPDPFEPASWTDWSPVRSVRLATPGHKPVRVEPPDPRRVELLSILEATGGAEPS